MISKRLLIPLLSLGLVGAAATVPWEDLTPADWLYSISTRFAFVDGHQVHYPTPTAELAKALEGRQESGALRQLADAKLALGDRKGAVEAIQKWAGLESQSGSAAAGQAWSETAHWAASHSEMALAFQASERALPGLPEDEKRALADERIGWAEQHPDLADPIAQRQARSVLFPKDGALLEDWVRALEKAGRLDEAGKALDASQALSPERRLLMHSDLLADHEDFHGAFLVLDGAVEQPWSMDFRRAYASRLEKGAPSLPTAWRGMLENHFDRSALLRLATYFEGKSRGDAVAGLLDQMERRYETTLARPDHLLLARLRAEVDGIPEAFRDTLSAAQQGTKDEQLEDLASLANLALRAGGRPLPWGTYNDEPYHWAAAMDRTPGFWTGGLSFFLTGQQWKESLDRLESESLPDRTFAVARALTDLLAQRSPNAPQLPSLRVAIMARFVERGEGREALALLPKVESASPAVADEARRVALLAARQVEIPLGEESRLFKARLAYAAPNGSRPALNSQADNEGSDDGDTSDASRPWARVPQGAPPQTYSNLLEEAISRLDDRDRSHRASLDLVLTEMDRLPDDEPLWLSLASRLESWNLDDELGPRLEGALQRFKGTDIWDRAARWYARRNYNSDLLKLAADVTARFRGSALFERAGADQVLVGAADQGRLVRWADWVRLKALERFPHSSRVFQEASRLVPASVWQKASTQAREAKTPSYRVVAPDALLEERRWAILFVDAAQREAFFARAMKEGNLEAKLDAMAAKTDRSPVEDLLLFEGRARLSQFELAMAPADHLASAYPGDGALAQRVLTLHRSLNGLDGSQAKAAQALVERTTPALEDPNPLWTELGELEEDRGHPEAAMTFWKHLVEREPRNPERVSELATLLWDYNHDREALEVVEQGRKLMGRPRFFAFETGVLRENVKDINGAIREYLDALEPEDEQGYGSTFENDQRSLRRLSQLLARPKVYALVEQRINALTPGVAEDEHVLSSFYPMATIETPAPGLAWDADNWIDGMDQPNDPVGRAQRDAAMKQQRPEQHDAIKALGNLLLAKTRDMMAKATTVGFLDAADSWSQPLIRTRWKKAEAVQMQNTLLARRAQLAPTEEDRIQQEMARATFLATNGRGPDADALWAQLQTRIGSLPEGAVRMRAEAQRAAFLERAKGIPAAAQEWQRLSARYPWSLGVLEDHVAFLMRTGQGEQARALLEAAIPKAGKGHREALLERLTQDSLSASDLPRARRAVEQLLAEDDLEDSTRLSAIQLLARLSWREQPTWDPASLLLVQKLKLKPELQADLYHALATAADQEGVSTQSLAMWIEALNLRTGRDWIQAAARASRKAGTNQHLLDFFVKQQERSPRDVRWAVAVRDIRKDMHDVEGAITAAKAAVAVRPEEALLWREAADLLVRAGRVEEAADYLAGWNKPRPADESVAGWRSGLYSQAGDGAKTLITEQAALSAFSKITSRGSKELDYRKARAVGRLMDQGHPDLALRLGSPRSNIRDLNGILADDQQCRLALLVNQFPDLLRDGLTRPTFLSTAGSVVAQTGRLEWREQALLVVLHQLKIDQGQPDDATLEAWWPFITNAGLESNLRLLLGQRTLASHPGPWQGSSSIALAESVGAGRIGTDLLGHRIYQDPDLGPLWVRDLVRRDQTEALVAYLQPSWQSLLAAVEGPAPVDGNSSRVDWSRWLDDPAALDAWARGAALHPETGQLMTRLMGDRYHWDRFWALAARGWQTTPLLLLMPEDARTAWFRMWEGKIPTDPVLLARRRSVESVTAALSRLIQNTPGAADDPLIVKLRGPQSVGEVLGHDSGWVWAEFAPRKNAQGEVMELGDDRVIGQGVDQGRLPGALWGDRPGEAWYVLEALARYRKGDSTAPYLPLEPTQRGSETARLLLAVRMAKAMGNLPLATELESTHPGSARDLTWLAEKVSLLVATGHQDQAKDLLQSVLRGEQSTLTEASFRWYEAHTEDWNLPGPLSLLDPAQPVSPDFLAFLQDRQPAEASAFHTKDPVGFRQALGIRWREHESQLTVEQLRRWMKELWVQGAAPMPSRRSLAKLGTVWPHAADWLNQQPSDRAGALESLQQALTPGGDASQFFTRLSHENASDADQLLAIRVRLARGERPQAMALVDGMVADLRKGVALAFATTPVSSEPAAMEGGDGEGEGDASPSASSYPTVEADPLVDRLKAWLAPFREAKAADTVEATFRDLLKERRADGMASPQAWRLAFELEPAATRPALAQELDEAWFRGDVAPEQAGLLAETLATALPSECNRWLDRWPRTSDFAQVKTRARILATLHRMPEAANQLAESRRVFAWSADEEGQAFDAWRVYATAPAQGSPASWRTALSVWHGKGETVLALLEAQLKSHPMDALAARAALRSLAPADEETLQRAQFALDNQPGRNAYGESDHQALFRLRAARGLLPQSWQAARNAMGASTPRDLLRIMVRRRYRSADINAALSDMARIAFKAGDDSGVQSVLNLLLDRHASTTKALRAELVRPPDKVEVYRMVNGRPTPYRPRDLTWTMLATVLKAEGVR